MSGFVASNVAHTIVRRRNLPLSIVTTLVIVALVAFIYAIATNPTFGWPIVLRYLFDPQILFGVRQTLILTVLITVLAIVVGGIVALMRLSHSKPLQLLAQAYVWFFRGAPVLVQLIFWFNLALVIKTISLPIPFVGTLFSVQTNQLMTPFLAAIVALSLHEAGYMAEIIRAGVGGIPIGQWEAAGSLGMPTSKVIYRIILPQSLRLIVPPIGNQVISLLKMTSLVSTIAMADLLHQAQTIYARTFETIPLLMVVTVWYLFLVSVLSVAQHYVERYYGKSDRA